jgi:hypothetical protein
MEVILFSLKPGENQSYKKTELLTSGSGIKDSGPIAEIFSPAMPQSSTPNKAGLDIYHTAYKSLFSFMVPNRQRFRTCCANYITQWRLDLTKVISILN